MSRPKYLRRTIAAILATVILFFATKYIVGDSIDKTSLELLFVGALLSSFLSKWIHGKGEKFLEDIGI